MYNLLKLYMKRTLYKLNLGEPDWIGQVDLSTKFTRKSNNER